LKKGIHDSARIIGQAAGNRVDVKELSVNVLKGF
jgi:hypothetical protein